MHRQVGAIWVIGLVALQSIPGTGALRTLFLLAGIAHLIVLSRRTPAPHLPGGRTEAFWLALLTGWLLVQSALISATPLASLANLASEWGKLLMMTVLAVLAAMYVPQEKERAGWLATGLFLGHFIHVLSTLAHNVWSWLSHGHMGLGHSLLGNYGYVSPFVTGALAFLLAEAVVRLQGKRWLPFSNGSVLAMILATVAAHATLYAKASLVVAVILFLTAAAATATVPRLRRSAAIFLLGGVLTVVASLTVINRWQGTLDALVISATGVADLRTLDATSHWQPPADSDGSVALRATWAKIGIEGIVHHPLGLGYGADAFGRYVAERGGEHGAVSSHSGWIDFALANGIPGLLLFLALLGAVMRRGWLAFRAGHPAGLACFLVVLNFAVRSVIDGNLAGSRLTGFIFVAALLWALSVRQQHAYRSA